MFHKILVAMDTSAIAKNVFDEALALAKATGLVCCCMFYPRKKKAAKYACISRRRILSRAGGRNLEIFYQSSGRRLKVLDYYYVAYR